MEDKDIIGAVCLARAANRTSWLPAALYACNCYISTTDILNGVSLGPETIRLEVADQIACLNAWGGISKIQGRTQRIFVLGGVKGLSTQCTTHKSCTAACGCLVLLAIDDYMFHDKNPFGPWDTWMKELVFDKGKLCSHCRDHLDLELKKHLRKEWKSLGDIFGVADWSPQTKDSAEVAPEDENR
ncbi:hypothetical protein BDY19DRAFT_668012 [Irpex rosettiformis]|uniref:Uncharacterized protein n=1 Tax=Irpex rosettiformis TaxID=378272 RepID=A0ACB8U9I2_9APHY|nr:hypothetical protein BDY19DRAFT_668012 [Irpex rosettiformis]